MDEKIHDTPSDVTAESGAVILDGPDGVAVALTPEAATETSDRLLFSAGKAKAQQIIAGKRRPR